MNRDACLRKYPRICAHLICESLGYYTPLSAANALAAAKAGKAFWCEWHAHYGGLSEEGVKAAGVAILRNAIRRRHHHKGYMAEYRHALALVKVELERAGATSGMLASWF